jgi:hypothetical protein
VQSSFFVPKCAANTISDKNGTPEQLNQQNALIYNTKVLKDTCKVPDFSENVRRTQSRKTNGTPERFNQQNAFDV